MLGLALKKLVSRLLFPMPVCIGLLLAGVLLLSFGRHRRSGLVLTLAALGALLGLGYGVPGNAVLRSLEWQYPPPAPGWSVADLAAGSTKPVWIVVLGGSLSADLALPATTRLEPHFLARVVEGFRLLRQDPRARLLLSLPGPLAVAQKRALADELCSSFGVEASRAQLITDALDTADEARNAARQVGDAPLLLVTSAGHLPRAMRLFAGVGLQPIACPADFLTPRPDTPGEFQPTAIFPSARNVDLSERALYECLGLAWVACRGQGAVPAAPARP